MDFTDPNALQRLAANPFESAWVAASAGSGKTKVLSDRVLNLLLTGTPPEKILCLTFTRTAAAQMANKIAERLAKWAAQEEPELAKELTDLRGVPPDAALIARARRLFARLLDTAGGLKVTTLHGFCQSLLKRFPLEAGVSPQFDVLDERGAKELIEQAQNKILGQSRYAACLETITAVTTEDGFLTVLTEMTTHLAAVKRIDTRFAGPEELGAAYEDALDLPRGCTPDSLKAGFCRLSGERENELRRAAAVLDVSKKKTDTDKFLKIDAFLNASEKDRLFLLPEYLTTFLTAENEIRKQLCCKESETALPAMTAEAQKAETLQKRLASLTIKRLSLALFELSSAVLNEYTALKNERCAMDYDDLIAAAKGLLEKSGAAAWVLFKLDGGVDHILVDEAQDTSPDQWAIIKALAEEFFAGDGLRPQNRTIFAVGDKKQSIFSFQGAVPEEFEKMRSFFKSKVESARKKFNDVPMYISFRSVQAVIDVVNFVLRFDPARKGVVDQQENAAHLSWRKKQAGLVEIWPTEKPQNDDAQRAFTKPVERVYSESPSARLARKIAQKIADMIFSKEILESENRPVHAGDIMILVRRRNAFINDLSRELKTRGVPVSGVDRLKITSHIAVKDLMALGDFLLLPEDDLTLATILRSPLCGVSPEDLSEADLQKAKKLNMPLDGICEDDLFTLAYNRGKLSLFDRLKTYEDKPDTPLGKAYLFLKDLLGRVDRMRPYELYTYILGPLERRKAFVSRLGVQALDALDEFMSLALHYDSAEPPSLQNFLKHLRQNDVEIKRDPEQSFDAVRIMTVHAAKGLQAPIVFLPDTRQLSFFAPKTFWPESGNGEIMLWAPKAEYRNEKINGEIEKLKEKDQDEYNRLLYVALTRAADRLYITGWDTSQITRGNWYDLVRESLSTENDDGSVVYHMEEVQTDLFEEPVLRLTSRQEEPPKQTQKESGGRSCAALPAWTTQPAPGEPVPPRPLAPSKPDTEEPAVLSPLSEGRLKAVRRGLAVHMLLEILPQYPAPQRRFAADKLLAVRAPDMTDEEKNKLAGKVLSLLDDPAAADLFTPDSLAEVPVSGVIGSRVINGKIDRLSVSENEVRLIDYKSGRVIPQDIRDTPRAYIRQMAAYKALIEKIYPGKNIRCFLLWTEAPKLTEITSLVCDTMEY